MFVRLTVPALAVPGPHVRGLVVLLAHIGVLVPRRREAREHGRRLLRGRTGALEPAAALGGIALLLGLALHLRLAKPLVAPLLLDVEEVLLRVPRAERQRLDLGSGLGLELGLGLG